MFSLCLPDLNSIVPLKSTSNSHESTKFKNLKLKQDIHFSDIRSIM